MAHLEGDQETAVGVNHRPFRSRIAFVKLTLCFRGWGQISRASCSRSASALRGRLPAFVTMNEGTPLSVTARLWPGCKVLTVLGQWKNSRAETVFRSEEHTSELQSLRHLVCRLLLEK